jgi:hypothetical protein
MQRLITRGAGPAVGLFLLAPLVAEFLLGNLPITYLFTLVLLAPLYGGGAVLIREAARRTGRGWPTILGLAVAYAILEEGVTSMSLFNPNYAGERLLDNGFIPLLGIGVPWTVRVITLHAVWSISVPIAVIELLSAPRQTQPWLRRRGLSVFAGLFAFGVTANAFVSVATTRFVASPMQLVLTVLVVAGVAVIALRLPPKLAWPRAVDGSAPGPWLVGGAAFVATGVFKLLPTDGSPTLLVGTVLLLAVLAIAAIGYWSHQAGWSDRHRLGLAAGALLTYALHSFIQTPQVPVDAGVDLVGNAIFAAGAVALVTFAAVRVARRGQASRACGYRIHLPRGRSSPNQNAIHT